ncbi:MAG: hypothetical protein LBG87_05305 [Spirochaetaceae bacterium]|nr:hypothetical protein [Spirochaetaceae bacterium]
MARGAWRVARGAWRVAQMAYRREGEVCPHPNSIDAGSGSFLFDTFYYSLAINIYPLEYFVYT